MDEKEFRKIVACNLRMQRARLKYSQEKLGELAELTQEYVNKIENEKCSPSGFILRKLADALNVKLNDIAY